MSKSQETGRKSRQSATTKPAVSVVLPTFNELGNVERVLEELREVFSTAEMAAFNPVEILIVDGGSTDGTREFARDLAETQDYVRFVHLRRKFGQSPALAAGFDHARGEIVIPMDADGQNDPHDIPALLNELDQEGLDCVSGWRFDRQDPWHKTIPSGVQTRLAKETGADINDFGCTLKVYRREALDEIDLYGEGHRYIPSKLEKLGYRVGELKVNHRAREHGESRYGAGRLVRGFVDLGFHWFWYRYSTRPLHLLGTLAFVFMAFGGVLGTHLLYLRLVEGAALVPHTPRLILISLSVIFGLQLLVFGVLAEMLTKIIYDGDTEYRVEELIGFD